jgi:MFS family permease
MSQKVTPWQVLKQREFGLFWASLLFSAVGSQISTVAIAWQVYEITNSPFQLGLAGLFRALPIMLLSIPGGVLADRMDRRGHHPRHAQAHPRSIESGVPAGHRITERRRTIA